MQSDPPAYCKSRFIELNVLILSLLWFKVGGAVLSTYRSYFLRLFYTESN